MNTCYIIFFIVASTPTIPTANTFSPISSSIKEITSKIQTSSIVTAIPPFIENAVANGLNIHIDSTSVVNAEEAIESPVKQKHMPKIEQNTSDIPIDELQRKLEIYNKIGEQEFDDTIVYKHSRRKKTNNVDMAASITSASSNSSEEKECNITRPTVMNLSNVILPDLRSPDTILNEIEQKEKILADMLNFDKVKAFNSDKAEEAFIGDGNVVKNNGDSHKKATTNLASGGSSNDIRVLAQAYPYFCNNGHNQMVSTTSSKLEPNDVQNTQVVCSSQSNATLQQHKSNDVPGIFVYFLFDSYHILASYICY